MFDDEEKLKEKYTYKTFCKGCRRGMTFAEQKFQYWRYIKRGFSKEQIRVITPRCRSCTTQYLKDA